MDAPSSPTPAISVIVPTFRRADLLQRCLECLQVAVARAEVPCEIVVSDDEAAPGAAGTLAAKFPEVRFVQGPGRGPAANRNHGASHARGAWLYFTDDDCEPEPDWIVAFLAAERAQPAIRVLEGRTYAGARIAYDEEAPVNECGGYLWSCNFAIRAELFRRLGGFDERFPFPRLEDVDLRERLRDHDERILYVDGAAVLHPPRPLRPVANDVRQMESYFHYARKRGLTVRASGLNAKTFLVLWRDRWRKARGAGEASRAVLRMAQELFHLLPRLPLWAWRYRRRTIHQRQPPEPGIRRPMPEKSWPVSWSESFSYDLEEVFGEVRCLGYAGAYRNRRNAALELIRARVPPGSRILDLAAGQGNFSLTLAAAGYEVVWNDLRAELADYVRLKHVHGKLEFAPGNAFELRFDQLFDAVLITEIIEHVAHPDSFLEQVAALVRPGGFIILTTPNGRYFHNPLPRFSDCADPTIYEAQQFRPNADGHIFLLHPDEFPKLAEQAGLELQALTFVTNPLSNGHFKTERLLRLLPDGVVQLLERFTRRLPRPLASRILIHTIAQLQRPS